MDISLTELFSWNFWTLEKSEVAKTFVLLITAIIGLFSYMEAKSTRYFF